MSDYNEPIYDDDSVQVLEGLEAVRKRPGMYIGGRDKQGLHHLVWEVVDNSADEALAGHGSEIRIRKNLDGSMTVRDYGRGIPVGINKKTGLSTVETVMTVLHAGGKFDEAAYKVSGGLHGVGISVVTALSTKITAKVWRDGKEHLLTIEDGGTKVSQPFTVVGDTSDRGTEITFMPDPTIFKETVDFDVEIIKERLKRSAFLNPKLRYIFEYFVEAEDSDEMVMTSVDFYSENGIVDYINNIITESDAKPLLKTFSVEKDGSYLNSENLKEDVKVKFAFTFSSSSATQVFSFVNNIPTPDGGPHYNSMFNAIKMAITTKAKEKKLDKKIKSFTAKDLEEGFTAIVAVYVGDMEFSGQTKTKLATNKAVSSATYTTIKDSLETYLEENPKVLKEIIGKIELSKRAREAAERSREAVRKDNLSSNVGILPTKLADCRSKDPRECELFIVEGDSAGGGAKDTRDGKTQAILPLKGKVLNAFKSKEAKILQNTEVGSLITAIGAGYGKNFDIEKARYHKIIIMTDADIDGGHIGFLLSLFFIKYMRPLVEAGYLYVVVPPLFRYSKAAKSEYFFTEEEREKFFIELWKNSNKGELPYIGDENSVDSIKNENDHKVLDLKELTKGWIGTRFKGLGEMNPDQLEETALNPETRLLKQLTIPAFSEDDAFDVDGLLQKFSLDDILMMLGGADSTIRKWFLMKFTSEIEVDV